MGFLGPERAGLLEDLGVEIDGRGNVARDDGFQTSVPNVFVDEPQVPKEYLEMDNIVLFPHLGSSSVFTRQKMEQLVVDNLLAWAAGKPLLSPVPETPWPPQKRA